jgi:hypothetical protein
VPQKSKFENVVGIASTTWYDRGTMAYKAMADNIRSQCLAFTAKRKCVLDKLTTGNFSADGIFDATEYAWNGRVLDRTVLHSIASGKTIHGISKMFKMEAVYKHCVKYPQIERHFHADIRALARMTTAEPFPAGETLQEPTVVDARATGDGPEYVDADVGHADIEDGCRPEGLMSAKCAHRCAHRLANAQGRCCRHDRNELGHNRVWEVET